MDHHQIMANPKDETTSKELRRSNRSRSKLSTFHIATTQTSQKEEEKRHVKGYNLNKQQALQKKIKNCNSNHMTITMKQGNNLVIELSTAAYEVFRTELKEILRTNTFLNSNYVVNYEPRYDEQELIVEETYKVHKKKNDGNTGRNSKFVVNSYRTNSSVLVNGSEIETFIQHILPNIQEFIQKTSTLLDEVNSSMTKTMAERINFNSMNTEIDKSDSPENEICIQTANIETNDMIGQTESTNDKEVNLFYRCPICREEAQEKTIACEECNEWYHYSCLKLSQLEINKIDPNIPYICDLCNEELLFTAPDVNNEQPDQNLGKPLIDMMQTRNDMQKRRVKDCQAEVTTLDSTPNPKSTFKTNLEPSDQNAQRPPTLNTQKEISMHTEKHKDCQLE